MKCILYIPAHLKNARHLFEGLCSSAEAASSEQLTHFKSWICFGAAQPCSSSGRNGAGRARFGWEEGSFCIFPAPPWLLLEALAVNSSVTSPLAPPQTRYWF